MLQPVKIVAQSFSERCLMPAAVFEGRAESENRFRRSLDDQHALAVLLCENRNAAAFEIERNFVDVDPAVEGLGRAGLKNCLIERAPDACCEFTVESGKFEDM